MALALFFVQAIAPVVPYMILAGAAGAIFGYTTGFFLAWLGALAGASCLFLLAKYLARDFFVRRLQDRYNFDLAGLEERKMFLLILICRIFPVVPTPIINIGSGISGVPTRTFFFASALGKIPWAIIYVALGDYFIQSQNLTATLMIVGIILLVSFFSINLARKHLL